MDFIEQIKEYLESISLFKHIHNGVDFPRIDYNDLKNKPSRGSSVITLNGQNLGGSATAYFGISQVSTNEADVQIQFPVAGTIGNFYVTTYTAQGTGGNYVLTLRKNGADTAVTITITASHAAGFFSDTTHSFTVAVGDKICVKGVNASGSAAADISGFSFSLT
jgi:hypothetical protein